MRVTASARMAGATGTENPPSPWAASFRLASVRQAGVVALAEVAQQVDTIDVLRRVIAQTVEVVAGAVIVGEVQHAIFIGNHGAAMEATLLREYQLHLAQFCIHIVIADLLTVIPNGPQITGVVHGIQQITVDTFLVDSLSHRGNGRRLEPPVYVLVGRRQVEPKLLLIGAQGLYTSAPATPTTWGVSTVPNSCKAVRSSTLYHELPEDFTILPVAASTSCILTQSLSRIYILSFSASYTAAPIGEGTLVTTPGVRSGRSPDSS